MACSLSFSLILLPIGYQWLAIFVCMKNILEACIGVSFFYTYNLASLKASTALAYPNFIHTLKSLNATALQIVILIIFNLQEVSGIRFPLISI